MRDAFGRVQSLLVLGGASEISAAIARQFVRDGCTRVVLAGRHPDAMEPVAAELRSGGAESVDLVEWDALDVAAHGSAVDAAAKALGDIDCVVLAAGVLGDQKGFDDEPATAAKAIDVNFGGAVSVLLHAAARMRRQGHGTLVVLSSVAGERVRQANYVYGASKAGLDAFAQGLGDSLVGSGASLLIVRPGFVRTRMTEGLKPAPFAATPEDVANAVTRGLAAGHELIWVPGVLRWVMALMRHLPRPVWRAISARQ